MNSLFTVALQICLQVCACVLLRWTACVCIYVWLFECRLAGSKCLCSCNRWSFMVVSGTPASINMCLPCGLAVCLPCGPKLFVQDLALFTHGSLFRNSISSCGTHLHFIFTCHFCFHVQPDCLNFLKHNFFFF